MNLAKLYAEKVCPACGFQLNFTPWEHGVQQERFCPCCGIHFGHDDADEGHRDGVYRAWRRHWISYGKRWWREHPPADFDPDEQLRRLEVLADEPQDPRR